MGEIAQSLIDAGAAVDDQNADGHTALMFAYNGRTQVRTLWERYSKYLGEASKKEGDDGGNGDIIQNAMNNHTAVVDMLVKGGADVSLKDKEGHTAADFDYKPPEEKKEGDEDTKK